MNKTMKRALIFQILTLLIVIIITIFVGKDFSKQTFVNYLFLIGMFVTVCGLGLFVINGGFFNSFAYGYRRMEKTIARNPEHHETINFETNFILSNIIEDSLVLSILYCGLFSIIVSTLIAYNF